MTYPFVSVVSLCHNRRANVAELFATLRHQTYPSFEVIAVDNASTDGTADMIRKRFPEVRMIETESNLGMVAYNLGFEEAQGEYLLVIDDDGLPASDDWITQAVSRFEENPHLGAISCTIRMRDTGRIAYDSSQFVPEGDAGMGYPSTAYNGTGAGLRASALRQTRFYPWHFFRTYLELHLCTQLLDIGWEVRHFPDIEVWHSRATDGITERPFAYYGLRNYYWYVWQFYPRHCLLSETLHELGSRAKMTLQGKISPTLFWRATRDAFSGVKTALAQRQPVSTGVLEYMRWVRCHGNWHGIAPETVAFGESDQDGAVAD